MIEREVEGVVNGDRCTSAGRQKKEDGDKEFCNRPGDFRRGEMAGRSERTDRPDRADGKGRDVANGDRRISAGRQKKEVGDKEFGNRPGDFHRGEMAGRSERSDCPEHRAIGKGRRGQWNTGNSDDSSVTNVK